jgi:AAHS family 4-hydroxybenzoate transporter-like MFS transporter
MQDASPTAGHTTDLVQLVDQQNVGRFHFELLGLCAAVVFMDGFDAQAIGYVAPSLSQAWQLAPGALGPVFGAGLFGIMLGALAGGPAADYLGRRRVIIFAALFFGICSLVTAVVKDVQQLLIIRFITGVGLGAAMPNAIALISEYSPKRHGDGNVLRILVGRSSGRACRRASCSPIWLAVGVRVRRRGSFAPGAGACCGAPRIRALSASEERG